MPLFNDSFQITLPQLEIYILVLIRVSFIFAVAPVFSSRVIPRTVKGATVAVLALVVYPAVPAGGLQPVPGVWAIVPAMVAEAAVGLMVGAAARMVFFAVQFAGHFIGFQMGFLIASTIDPQEGQKTPLIAQFQETLALLLFLGLNGHHWLLKGLAASYQMVPPFGATLSGAAVETFLEFTGQIFVIGLKIAAPVMVVLFMTKLSVGILARTVPQMNVFVVSLPLNIGVGFLAIALSLQVVVLLLEERFQVIGEDIVRLLAGFR